jgi:hypothetical protein
MPIRPHLDGQTFDAQTMRIIGLSYEMALVSLRLVDRGGMADDVVAHKIIDLAKAGERDPVQLCESVLRQWSRAAAHVAPTHPEK